MLAATLTAERRSLRRHAVAFLARKHAAQRIHAQDEGMASLPDQELGEALHRAKVGHLAPSVAQQSRTSRPSRTPAHRGSSSKLTELLSSVPTEYQSSNRSPSLPRTR